MRGKDFSKRDGSRQRLCDAFAHRFTGDVPFFECYVAEEVVDQVMGRPMGTHMLKLPPRDYVELLKRTGMDAAYLYEGWFLGRKNKVDENGRVHYVDGTIKGRADFDQIVPPSLDIVTRRIESYLEAAQGTDLGAVYALDVPHSIALTCVGPQDFYLAAADDPGFLNELFDRLEEYTLPLVETVAQYALDAIWFAGLFCSNKGPMLSPQMHEELIFPRIEKIMQILRPTGIPVVLHSDGDNSMFMDRIIETGIAALHPIESGIGNFDIYELKRTYGDRICLCGNIDVGRVLWAGKPEDVRADVLEHLRRLAPGGGYVCGSSHDITEKIPFENFCALADTICSTVVHEDGTVETMS